jgi:PAS domain S-box-containing protein
MLSLHDDPLEIYRALLEHSVILISIVDDTDAGILRESRSVGPILGYERHDRVGRSFFDFLHPEDAPPVRAAFERALVSVDVTPPLQCRIRRRDESWLPIELVARYVLDKGRQLGIVQSHAVSERRELEVWLRHVERLNAIGRMTVALAHDFDRLFAAMQGHLRALPVDPSRPTPLGLRAVGNGVEAGASLIRQFLLLGQMAPTTFEALDVNAVLDDLVLELGQLLGDTVKVIFAAEAEHAVIRGDRGKLQRALMNVALTLRDAMPEGGVLLIGARNVTLADEMRGGTESREYVVIDVADAGDHVPRDARIRLVDPYMATTDSVPSQGVWLVGRAMIYDTVQSFGGFIDVDSDGGGLAFHLHLPCSHDDRAV